MKFHISCAGRSGSVYAHRVLSAIGLRCVHEKPSERPFREAPLVYVERNPAVFQLYEGLIGWQWDVSLPNLVASVQHKFFMTRDPLNYLPSAMTHQDTLFDLVEKEIGAAYVDHTLSGPALKATRAVNFWLGYVERFMPGRRHLFVESFQYQGESLEKFAAIVGVPPEPLILAQFASKTENTRRWNKDYDGSAIALLTEAAPRTLAALLETREQIGYGPVSDVMG